MSLILPCFSTHYSFSSILTLEEASKTDIGNPVSVIDLARQNHLKQVVLVEDRIDGFLEAHKNLSKVFKPVTPKSFDDYLRDELGDKKKATDSDRVNAQKTLDEAIIKYEREKTWSTEPIQLIYGLRFIVVSDMLDKAAETKRQESRVIVFLKNTQGYYDLLKLWNRAWVEGHFTPPRESGYGRIDWKTIKQYWTPNLSMALPFFSSCLARNTLTFANIVPDFPVPANELTLFREVDSGLPFAHLIDRAIDRFAADTGAAIQPVKSVYYAKRADFDAYVVYRAILKRETFSAPNVDSLCSNRFSFEDWMRLREGQS